MVVNQKEADVYPQNVPYTFSTPFHRDYFLSKLSAFKNLSEATTPEAKNYCFLVENDILWTSFPLVMPLTVYTSPEESKC